MKLKKLAAVISCTMLGLAISSCSTNKADNDTSTTQEASTQQQAQVPADENSKQDSTTKQASNTTTSDDGTATATKQDSAPQQTEAPKLTMNADASYVVGYQVGSGIAKQDFGLDSEQVAAGFKSAIDGSKPRISESEIRRNMESLKDKMIKKQLEVADNNKSKSQDFIKMVAGLDGVVEVNDGVYYQMIKKGDGKKPSADSQVTIAYEGTTPVQTYNKDNSSLKDIKAGKLIGPSFDSSESATFPLTNLIQCWKDAIPQIPNGSTVILYCSPDKAYGTRAPASIGPNQALAFKITLKDFK